MKRLFVSLMVIGGSILFGMQAAESAPKKLTLKERAIKCAERATSDKARKGCFRKVIMQQRRRSRAARARLCGKLGPAAKSACRKRFRKVFSANERALGRRLGIGTRFKTGPKKLTLKERAIKCAKRSRTKNVAVPLSELLGSEKQVRKGCFRRVVMAERRRVRAARNRLCGKLSSAAKKACEKRFGVNNQAKARAFTRSLGIKARVKGRVKARVRDRVKRRRTGRGPQGGPPGLGKVRDRVRTRVKDRVRSRVTDRARERARATAARERGRNRIRALNAKRIAETRRAIRGKIRSLRAQMNKLIGQARRICARGPKASRSACIRSLTRAPAN